MMKLIFFGLTLRLNPVLFTAGSVLLSCYLFLQLPQPMLANSPETDFLSVSLAGLTSWLVFLMVLANLSSKNGLAFVSVMKAILISLMLSFFSSSALLFYFWFEVSLIPVFWLILGWGYQPERFLAGVVMVFYTLISSLPLLAALILVWNSTFSFSLPAEGVGLAYCPPAWVVVSLILAFLIKFPMFLAHLWLPKAHVEAPVSGSMILAGVLLKLGGYGIYRLSSLFSVGPLNSYVMVVASLGGAVLGVLCCRAQDMKVLIAYSSVVHMALIILSLMSMEGVGLGGVWWVMLGHGLVSSGLFACANMMYEGSHSRSIILNKGILSYSPLLSLVFFTLVLMNFGGPFTLNLYGELNLAISAISASKFFGLPVFLITFFSAAYSLILYAATQQGTPSSSWYFLSGSSSREMLIMWSHVWPGIAVLGSLSL